MKKGETKFTTVLEDEICEEIAFSELGIEALCKNFPNWPSPRAIYRRIESDPGMRQKYARARERQADFLAQQIIEIADDGRRDYKLGDGDSAEPLVDHDHIARARLRVDARKWAASKLAPKKYGDKVQQEHTGPEGGPVVMRWQTPEEAGEKG